MQFSRLSNKVVQVIFQDSTEIVLSSQLRVVTYVNKKHERLTYPLNSALESTNKEMAKRLKYTKDILTHMLNANAANLNKPNTEPKDNPIGPGFDGPNSGQGQSQTGRPQTSNLPHMAA